MSKHLTKSLAGEAAFSEELTGSGQPKGEVRAVICTYGVKDKDGDVVVKGAIPDGSKVILSAYNHDSIKGNTLPVGAGSVTNVGNEAILEAKFFTDTQAGLDAFKVVKNLSEAGLGEWSFGFYATEQEPGELDGKSVNLIHATKTFEASFVAVGAGVNTRTLEAKAAEFLADDESAEVKREVSREERDRDAEAGRAMPDGSFPIDNLQDLKNAIQAIGRAKDPEAAKRHIRKRARALGHEDLIPESWGSGKKFAEEIADVVTSMKSLRSRAEDVLALRQEKGKSLSEESASLLREIVDEADGLRAVLAEITTPANEDFEASMAETSSLLDQFLALPTNILGDME